MDGVGGVGAIEVANAVSLPGFKAPSQASVPVPGKREREIETMAAMRYMPYVSGKLVWLSTRHETFQIVLWYSARPESKRRP